MPDLRDLKLHDCEGMINGIEFVRMPDGQWRLIVFAPNQEGGTWVISNLGHHVCSKCGKELETGQIRHYFRWRNIPLDEHLSNHLKVAIQPVAEGESPEQSGATEGKVLDADFTVASEEKVYEDGEKGSVGSVVDSDPGDAGVRPS